jgi:hypothetical protein
LPFFNSHMIDLLVINVIHNVKTVSFTSPHKIIFMLCLLKKCLNEVTSCCIININRLLLNCMDFAWCTIFVKSHVRMLTSSCISMVYIMKICMLHLKKCNFKTQKKMKNSTIIKQSIGTKGNSLF